MGRRSAATFCFALMPLLLGAACTPFSAAPGDGDGGGVDASTDAPGDGSVEGGPLMPDSDACDPTKPFVLRPFPPPIMSSGGAEDGAFLAPSGLTAYFSSNRDGQTHLFVATRSSPISEMWKVDPLAVLNGGTAKNPNLSPNELTIYFESDRIGGLGGFNIWSSVRPALSAEFAAPVPVANVSSETDDTEPWIAAGGLRLYFTTNRINGYDIYVSGRASTTVPFDGAVGVMGLTGSDNEASAVFTQDELTVFFSSDRDVPGVGAGRDVWTAHRENLTVPFGPAALVPQLNTAADDYPTWVSPNGCSVIVESGAPNAGRLFIASRSK